MTNLTRRITAPQRKALNWLIKHGGTGAFDATGTHVISDAGVQLPYKRETWVGLRDAGRIEFYNLGKGGRVRVVEGTT